MLRQGFVASTRVLLGSSALSLCNVPVGIEHLPGPNSRIQGDTRYFAKTRFLRIVHSTVLYYLSGIYSTVFVVYL